MEIESKSTCKMDKQKLLLRIKQYDHGLKTSSFKDFAITPEENLTIMEALKRLRLQDPTLTFTNLCQVGKSCKDCMAKINGKSGHLCDTELADNTVVEPLNLQDSRFSR